MAKQKRLEQFAIAKGVAFKDKFPKQYDNTTYVLCEDKFDGLRGIVIVHKDKAFAYTSTGVRVVNAAHICKALNRHPFHGRVYDGEYFYKDWNTTQSIVKSQTKHKLRKHLTFKIFDCITLKEWTKQKGRKQLHARKIIVKSILAFINRPDILKEVKSRKIPKTIEAAKKALRRAVKHGHEGCMLKDPNAMYEFKRSANWLKLKPFQESDLKIVDAKLGTEGLAHCKVLGRLYLKGVIDGKKVSTKVGSGFKAAERKKFWKMYKQGKLIGMRVMIKHEGLTANNAVRFPEFLRLRTDD